MVMFPKLFPILILAASGEFARENRLRTCSQKVKKPHDLFWGKIPNKEAKMFCCCRICQFMFYHVSKPSFHLFFL